VALTTAEEVAAVLKKDVATAPAFLKAYKAAERWVAKRCTWETVEVEEDDGEGGTTTVTQPVDVEDLVQAIILLTGRYMARKNSPDGLVGMGELGVMRISAIDRDVRDLVAKNRKIVL